MVVMKDGVQASSQKRSSRHDFPTPEMELAVRIAHNVHGMHPYQSHQSEEAIEYTLALNPECQCRSYAHLDQEVVVRRRHDL